MFNTVGNRYATVTGGIGRPNPLRDYEVQRIALLQSQYSMCGVNAA